VSQNAAASKSPNTIMPIASSRLTRKDGPTDGA
jgi:hypothetical protein